jgi:site-specific DNA-methyltransferase (adenine-specific)
MITATNEDCMLMMARYPDDYFDLALVDPPYGIDITKMKMGGRKRNKTDKGKNWDNQIPSPEYFRELFRISKNQIIWGGNYFDLPCSQYFCVWDKGETMYGRDFAEAELAWVRKGGTRIYKKSPNQLDRIHPTQKHVSLYEFCLMNYAKEGDKILDTHRGSASLDIACHNLNFDLVTCELDTDYFNDGNKRLKQHQNQQVMKFEL